MGIASTVLAASLGLALGVACGPRAVEKVDRNAECDRLCSMLFDPVCGDETLTLTQDECMAWCVDDDDFAWEPCVDARVAWYDCLEALSCEGRHSYFNDPNDSTCDDVQLTFQVCSVKAKQDR